MYAGNFPLRSSCNKHPRITRALSVLIRSLGFLNILSVPSSAVVWIYSAFVNFPILSIHLSWFFCYRSKGSNNSWYHFHFSHGPYPFRFSLQVLVFLYFLSFLSCHSTISWHCNINDFTHFLFLLHNHYVWSSRFDFIIIIIIITIIIVNKSILTW